MLSNLIAVLVALLTACPAYVRAEAAPSVAPSGPSVPEQLLRISITFANPPQGATLPFLALQRADGSVIPDAFLDQELWSPDRRTLTVLLNPGRVKSGLLAHDSLGAVLVAGDQVALTLHGSVLCRWAVSAGGCVVPDPSAWHIGGPRPGTRMPVTIDFPAPIDRQSEPLIAIADEKGHRVVGESRLASGERRWEFTPASPWTNQKWNVVVHPRLESPCGDEMGEAFEHAVATGLGALRSSVILSLVVEQ